MSVDIIVIIDSETDIVCTAVSETDIVVEIIES